MKEEFHCRKIMVVDAHSLNNNLVRLDVPYAMTTLKIFTTMYLQQCFPATGIFLVLLDKSLDYIFFFFVCDDR